MWPVPFTSTGWLCLEPQLSTALAHGVSLCVPSKGLPWDKGSYLSPGYTPSMMTACTQRLDSMDKNLGLLPQFGTTLKGNPSSGASSGIPSSQSCFPHSIRSVLTKIIPTTLPLSACKSSFQGLILENTM